VEWGHDRRVAEAVAVHAAVAGDVNGGVMQRGSIGLSVTWIRTRFPASSLVGASWMRIVAGRVASGAAPRELAQGPLPTLPDLVRRSA
jgi:beta-glucosidase-like glycosyl hydrolase